MRNLKKQINLKILNFLSCFVSIILFTYRWYSDFLLDNLSLVFFLLSFLIFSIFICCFRKSIIYVSNSDKKIKDFLPILILSITAILWLFLPIRMIRMNVELSLYEDKREEVITMIQNETLKSDEYGIVVLPKGYKQISNSGELKQFFKNDEHLIVGFWIFRGLTISESEMVVYSNLEEDIIKEHIGCITEIKKLKDNWYYVSIE